MHHVEWFHAIKTDPIHRNVMKTKRKFVEDEGMDLKEAAEAAINKRKFLLNKMFKKQKEPSTIDAHDFYLKKNSI